MSLLATRLQSFRAQAPNLDQWTLRPSAYGAWGLFLEQTNNGMSFISDDLRQKARAAVNNDVQIPVFNEETVTIGNTRTVTIADSENTSALYTVSFTRYHFGFTIVPVVYQGNEMSMQRDFNRKLEKYLLQLASTLDTNCVSAIDTARTQVFSNLLGQYTNTGNSIAATLAQREKVIGALTPMMNANDFYGQFYLLGNPGVQNLINELAEKSVFNEANKTIQYTDKMLAYTNRISDAANKTATGYLVQNGMLGLVDRQEPEAILGTKAGTSHEWGIELMPLVGIPMSTYYYESVGDFSAIAGAASGHADRALKQHFAWSVDIGLVTAYNSDRSSFASGIMKFDIADA